MKEIICLDSDEDVINYEQKKISDFSSHILEMGTYLA